MQILMYIICCTLLTHMYHIWCLPEANLKVGGDSVMKLDCASTSRSQTPSSNVVWVHGICWLCCKSRLDCGDLP